ncbi:subtilisin family serine protease [Hymenobacter luteus]|uniref:Subtilisin family serine protease n=2 Tax=Hymenobacter TaxID=89966 RepID=A0A7W9T1V5_9BACT|nr:MULTISPECIES: S8 family serine peptidase [Hymenobacter]MBB4602141.1 subtilisin family serine protease [Hymenobacter latericoloratus]MBB6059430.1 subtilisin family serine protease [Hymenobacter luteus]
MRFYITFLALFVVGSLRAGAAAPAATAPPTTRYWVTFRDKGGQQLRPGSYFSPAAQARRRRQHLPPADSTDFPVRPDYVARVRALADSVTLVSRWFNAVACRATPSQAARLRQLPGVSSVTAWPEEVLLPAAHAPAAAGGPLTTADRSLARRQAASLGAADFRQARLNGRGLRIAIFDVGFTGADRHPAFAHLRRRGAIVATYDFLRRTPAVYQGGSHGTEVLSCIAGRLPDSTRLGLGEGAEFLLARTEQMHREKYAEEEAWLAAAEWADRNGADIINSSLGYTTRRYFPEQMNGRTSLVARAAELAVRKGILVVNAAGNDGDDPQWRTVGTPADGDSVLAVGGVDPDTYLHLDFSSYGPAPGQRLKPNVAAFGVVIAAAPGGYVRTEGTSFASPLVAGFAACVWQQQRHLTAMQLFARLQESASLYPYFDYAHGYGLPRAAFFTRPAPEAPASFDVVRQDSVLAVIIREEAARVPARTLPLFADSVRAVTEPAAPAVAAVGQEQPRPAATAPAELVPAAPPAYLYWQLMDREGRLLRYEVLEVQQRAVLRVPLRLLRPGYAARVHYQGYTKTYVAP